MDPEFRTAAASPAAHKLPTQDVLPFPPTPSGQHRRAYDAGVGLPPRVSQPRLPDDAPNILIVLIDDAGPGLPSDVRRRDSNARRWTASLGKGSRTTDFTRPRCARRRARRFYGTQSSSCGQRADRRVGQRLGRLFRPNPQEQRARRRSAEGLRLRHRGLGQVAQYTGRGDHRGRPLRQLADRISASSTSTAFSRARRRSTSRTWCETRPSSCRREGLRRAITLAKIWRTTPFAG